MANVGISIYDKLSSSLTESLSMSLNVRSHGTTCDAYFGRHSDTSNMKSSLHFLCGISSIHFLGANMHIHMCYGCRENERMHIMYLYTYTMQFQCEFMWPHIITTAVHARALAVYTYACIQQCGY